MELEVVDRSEKKRLVEALDGRNECGHPVMFKPGPNEERAYIEDVTSGACSTRSRRLGDNGCSKSPLGHRSVRAERREGFALVRRTPVSAPTLTLCTNSGRERPQLREPRRKAAVV